MNIQKVDNWLNAIIYEDGHKMSVGSLRTLELIRKECCISQAPKEPETVHGNEAEKEVLNAMDLAREDEAIGFAKWLYETNWGEKETWGKHDPPSIPSINQLYDIYCESLNVENISSNKSCSPSDWHKGGKCDLNGCYHE